MISKCVLVALFAVVATAAPACQTVAPSCGSGCGSTSGAITRNIVAKGKYPVALKNCGPTPDKQIPVTTSHVTAPVQEKPTVRLPCNIPAPRTVCHTCTCYKTILRPRVHQQIITVPTVQRYIQTTHKPIIENIQYEAIPVNCEGSCECKPCGVEIPSCEAPRVVETPRCESCEVPKCQVEAPKCQTVQLPCFEVETPKCQVEAPKCQTIEIPRCPCVEAPKCQTVEIPRCQVVEAPRCQVVEAPKCQTIEIPRCPVVEAPKCQTVEIPRIRIVEAPKCQVVEAPKCQVVEAPKCQTVELPKCFSSCGF